MSMLRDQRDLLCAFNAEGVEYLVVGGHAVNAHGVPRLTKDLDVFIRGSEANSERVFRALARFGAPLAGYSSEDFVGHEEDVLQIGVEPNRIDILQAITGVDFEAAWQRREMFEVEDGLTAPFLSLDDVLTNKLEVGRPQDLADADRLTKMKKIGRQ
jgi:hypothetical protein